jgi:hypothetical protein
MPRPGPLSLNTATVRERWGLAECVDNCARHGISCISPWRDALADAGGVQRGARRIREAGLVHILEMNGDSYRLKQSKRHQHAARAASIPDSPSAT